MREGKTVLRNPIVLGNRLMMGIIMCVLVCIVYTQLGHDYDSIQDRNGYLMWVAINHVFCPLSAALVPFLYYKPVFLRENSTRLYGIIPYFIANLAITLPLDIILAII